jgi:hypothetical protein
MSAGPPRGRTRQAHNVSWEFAYGSPPNGWLLHHCDVRNCVRPDHLYIGTAANNVRDMWERGRGVKAPQPSREQRARGSRHGVAKLTEEQVAEIRQRYGPATGRRQKGIPMPKHPVSQQQLADEYGVHQSIISDIVRHEYWQHVS